MRVKRILFPLALVGLFWAGYFSRPLIEIEPNQKKDLPQKIFINWDTSKAPTWRDEKAQKELQKKYDL